MLPPFDLPCCRLLAMLRLSQRLRSCLSTSVSSLLPLPASSPSPPHLHTPSLSPDPAGDARETGIYILGEQREREVELGEALQGLRAYSMAPTPETVAVNVKVNMTLKRVRINWSFTIHTLRSHRIYIL